MLEVDCMLLVIPYSFDPLSKRVSLTLLFANVRLLLLGGALRFGSIRVLDILRAYPSLVGFCQMSVSVLLYS